MGDSASQHVSVGSLHNMPQLDHYTTCLSWITTQHASVGSLRNMPQLDHYATCLSWITTQHASVGSLHNMPQLDHYTTCLSWITTQHASVGSLRNMPQLDHYTTCLSWITTQHGERNKGYCCFRVALSRLKLHTLKSLTSSVKTEELHMKSNDVWHWTPHRSNIL